MNFEAWLDELAGGETRREIAKKAGYAQSTITRQLSRGHIRPETVIALCRAYNRSPVTGLIETGYLQEWETEGVAIPYALHNATNEQILDEIMRRSDPEAHYLFTGGDHADVVDLPASRRTDGGTRSDPTPYDGTVREWDATIPHAADSSPDEQAEREKRGENLFD